MSEATSEIVTPPVRLAFPALFTPRPKFQGSEEETYQATLLLPPDTDLTPFQAAIKAAIADKFGGVQKLTSPHKPIRVCEGQYQGFDEGWHFIRASSKYAPGIVDQRKREIVGGDLLARGHKASEYQLEDGEEILHAGVWVRAHLRAFAWKHTGNTGVSWSLNNLQLVRPGERLDGRKGPGAVFDEIEDAADMGGAFAEEDSDDFLG